MKPFSINELKRQKYFVDHIRWDVTPRIFMSPRITTKDGSSTEIDTSYGYMLYVDMVNNKPALFIMQLLELMSKTVGYVVDVPDNLLKEALKCQDSECIAGMYPLSENLKKWLKENLGLT